jgi:N,N'-diacetylchitobiose transport system permease protein
LSHYGLGSAVAVVLFLILLVFSLVYVRMIGREGELA